MSCKPINTSSMIGYNTYMQDRIPSHNTAFYVNDLENIEMSIARDDSTWFSITFHNETDATFEYETDGYVITRDVASVGEFTSAIIEFTTMDKKHFDGIIDLMKTSPAMFKKYGAVLKEGA